jgi:hypothetical protein
MNPAIRHNKIEANWIFRPCLYAEHIYLPSKDFLCVRACDNRDCPLTTSENNQRR